MADSSTLRARRSRAHRAGDHSICKPDRCVIAASAEPVMSVSDDLEFGPSGRDLWTAVKDAGHVGPLQAVLLVEACRIADRLDVLDRQLHGHDWLRFRHDPEDQHEVVVYVDRVLAEAREQATALKGIVAELTKPVAKKPEPAKKGGGVLADLAARRAARSALPTG